MLVPEPARPVLVPEPARPERPAVQVELLHPEAARLGRARPQIGAMRSAADQPVQRPKERASGHRSFFGARTASSTR